MDRETIVSMLEELALLSEVLGENPFKARAYAGAARTLSKVPGPVETWPQPGVLEAFPGVGKAIAEKVREALASGSMAKLEELRAEVPEGVREMLVVPGLGPKKASVLWRDLGVLSLGELEYACLENRLVRLKGFGEKTQEKVLSGVRFRLRQAGRFLLPQALAARRAAEARLLRALPDRCWAWTGEAARLCPVVQGLEVLTVEGSAARAAAEVLGLPGDGQVPKGTTADGFPLTLRSSPSHSFGASLVWHASAPPFREALAERLAAAGLAWTEHGLHSAGAPIPTPTEEAFWAAVGRPPTPVECRELPEALDVDLSALVAEEDLRGAFHVHTDWSDGGASLEAMAAAAAERGWAFLGIADHSRSAVYAGGLDEGRLTDQRRAVEDVRRSLPSLRIYHGVESDILSEGALDYSDDVLASLEGVVASVHSRFALAREEQTRRLTAALSHPATAILGHPTGRLLLSREGYDLDWDAVVDAAAAHGKALELNANPHRLDVDWRRIPGLMSAGVAVAINPDAHAIGGLDDLRYGVWAARKGLARRERVVNAWSAEALEAWLRGE